MDSRLRFLAARQDDVVAAWQLRRAGWSVGKVQHHARCRGWRRLHLGVFLLTSSAPTRRQLWWAAALTSPDSFLSHGSGGACYGFHRFNRGYEVITRPGQGGRRRHGGVLVFRSKAVEDDVTRFEGIPITTAARVLVDICAGLDDRRLARAFRESIRLKRTSASRILECADRHAGAPGSRRLTELATRYAHIPYHRTRSDAEGLALSLLRQGRGRRGGSRPAQAEGDHRDRLWRAAGFVVRRISSDEVYGATPDGLRRRLGL